MLRLRRLTIHRFRNVKPGTTLQFGGTFNVLLGKNATGKTTLLDLVTALVENNLARYRDEKFGYDLRWTLEDDGREVDVHAKRSPLDLEGSESPSRDRTIHFRDEWTWSLRSGGHDIGSIEASDGNARVRFPDGIELERRVEPLDLAGLRSLLGERDPVLAARLQQLMTVMPQGYGVLPRFDEALGVFSAILGAKMTWSRIDSAMGGSAHFEMWVPDALASVLMRGGFDDASGGRASFDKLVGLQDIPRRLGFVDADLRPRLLDEQREGSRLTTSYQGLEIRFHRHDGTVVSHQLLSFGQKRLLAFLWYLAAQANCPIVADELLNGLHYEWIATCVERLMSRQSFLATQHPMLLDHIPVESMQSVLTTFVRCTLEADAAGDKMVWRNFTEEEAERFSVAYATGIQQVSEVLRTEGLW